MAFKAKLSLSGKDFTVLTCSYNFAQGINPNGSPSSDIRGGQVQLSVLSSDDTTLVQWMVAPSKTMDGSITIYKPEDDQQALKTIKFTKAFCINHSESFSNNGGYGMVENIVLSAQKLEIGDATHENEWAK